MNSLYLILIALCFSAGVLTTVLKSDNPKTTKIFDKNKTDQCNENKALIDTEIKEAKPLMILSK